MPIAAPGPTPEGLSPLARFLLPHCDGRSSHDEVLRLMRESGLDGASNSLEEGLKELARFNLLEDTIPSLHRYCVVQPIGLETLVYDQAQGQVHLLDERLSDIVRQCDGITRLQEVEGRVGSDSLLAALARLEEHKLLAVPPLNSTRRRFVAALSLLPAIVTLAVPHPSQAASSTCADCTVLGCSSPGVTASPPPAGLAACTSCCGTCHLGAESAACSTCPAGCTACVCMRNMVIVGGAGGTCRGDTARSFIYCMQSTGDAACGGLALACQADCAAARTFAINNGSPEYNCCTNCN